MTTLVAVYNSGGCVGRCDANCYEAKGAKCTCICGGMNHRAGRKQAEKNLRDKIGLRDEDLQRFAQVHELEPGGLIALDRLFIKDRRRANAVALSTLKRRATEPDLFEGHR